MKKWIPYICTAAAIVVAVLAWIFVKDPLTIQVSRDGLSATTVPKIIALPVPLLVSIVGSILNYRSLHDETEESDEKDKSSSKDKNDGKSKKEEGNGQAMLISALGLVILVVMCWANLG